MRNIRCLFAIFVIILSFGTSFASDEGVQFSNVNPNALIILDRSGSMNWTPAGEFMCTSRSQCSTGTTYPYYSTYNGTTGKCPNGYTTCDMDYSGTTRYYSTSNICADPIYATTGSIPSNDTECSKIAIAKTALFNLLNADHADSATTPTITSTGTMSDDLALDINMGYLNFYNCEPQSSHGNYTGYNTNCISVPSSTTDGGFGTKYAQLYCGIPAQPSATTCQLPNTYSHGIASATAVGGTPLADSLRSALTYISTYENSTDTNASACRQNFAILLTDGADTYACPNVPSSGWGQGGGDTVAPPNNNDYPRRKSVIAQAYAMALTNPLGYQVFTIGFGSDMPRWDRNTLGWAAYWGTPSIAQAYKNGTLTPIPAIIPSTTPCTNDNTNDPGAVTPPSGYGFFAQDPLSLANALQTVIQTVKKGTYSFSISSVSTARITSENNIYEAAFEPLSDTPLWQGHLYKYAVNNDGSVGSLIWDAGIALQAETQAAKAANMYTLISGALTPFSTSINPSYFGFSSSDTVDATAVVNYFQGQNPDNWKLGDTFHSVPVVITSPSAYFEDSKDSGAYPNAFDLYRAAHQRTSVNGQRVVVAGANDGQLHIFETNLGAEVFSFVPPNLLPKLQLTAHATIPPPSGETHQYYIDGPISAADVWLGTWQGSGTQTVKDQSQWHTIVVVPEGRGAGTQTLTGTVGSAGEGTTSYLWSSSPTCDSGAGYYYKYTSGYPYYCGYYAFDFTTNTNSPTFMWTIKPSAASPVATFGPYLAEPWSKMAIGRMKINGVEKWVGFIGGGAYSYVCGSSTVGFHRQLDRGSL